MNRNEQLFAAEVRDWDDIRTTIMKLALVLIFSAIAPAAEQNLEDMDIIDIMMDGQKEKSVIEKNIEKNMEQVVILVM